MTLWNVLSPSGGLRQEVFDLLKANGLDAVIDRACPDPAHTLVITSGLDDYAWVMLGHWQSWVLPSKRNLELWIDPHYLGPPLAQGQLPTASDWAQHVVRSYEHIGRYAPLNCTLEDLTCDLKADPLSLHDLAMNQIVLEPVEALTQLEALTQREFNQASRDQFLTSIDRARKDRKAWTQAVQQLRPTTQVY